MCAKKILLAINTDEVDAIDWKPMQEQHRIARHTQGVKGVPALRIFFTYR